MKHNRRHKRLSGRMAAVCILLGLQLGVILAAVIKFTKLYPLYRGLSLLLGIGLLLHLIRHTAGMGYKLAWTVLILLFPLFGASVYLMFSGSCLSSDARKRMERSRESHRILCRDNGERDDRSARYLRNQTGFAPCSHDGCRYYSDGAAYYEALLAELETVENSVWLETFILAEGEMWDGIHRILRQKAAAGADVRVIYDDLGSMGRLPENFRKTLEREGIRCAAFHRFLPVLSAVQNNRDHRKICVIDGKTAFTGGINIGDEYIGRTKPLGHWKDSGVMIRGEAARCFAAMFLTMWDYITGERTQVPENDDAQQNGGGTVQPYCFCPQDDTAENVYLDLIGGAERSLWIMTPYLIPDEAVEKALIRAAQSGVDVRIVTPGIPDKKAVYEATRAHYPALLRKGVRIWEYTPGFLHGKTILADEKTAVVGSVNLDYRSFYLHFECGVRMTDPDTAADIRRDFLRTFEVSREIREGKTGLFREIFRGILELLAPLL